ncbi:hypothetical protein F5X96DRAFT_591303 [Biscogniauxia mediterranea]|nr:hypothetical protein F5X96DRAFT_591303 [Biscogniauxia mediterranea]
MSPSYVGMGDYQVLRFPISGQDGGSFLLEVSSHGSRPLDLKLVGSESTAVFTIKLRHRKISDYKAANGPCTDEEWERILTSVFVEQQPVPDIEVRADVQSNASSVSLSFRKNIQGITQRLGSIKLDENDKAEISPFDWCVCAIAARTKVAEDLAAATANIKSLENTVNELKDQLDELIKAKDEHETELLEKFRDLLNEKKVKIRQQQRLLASASIDPDKLVNVGASQNTLARAAEASRSGKRKAIKEESDSSDAGFERMDTEDTSTAGALPDQESDGEGQATTEEDTPSETDSEPEPVPAPPKSEKSTATATKPTTRTKAPKRPAVPSTVADSDEEPPPRRVLPFKGKKAAAPSPPKPEPADDEETESDDEL